MVVSKLLVFVVVLVSSHLNIKIWYVKFYSVYFTRTAAVLETIVVVIRTRKIAGRYFSNCQSQYFIFRTGLCLSCQHYSRSVGTRGCVRIKKSFELCEYMSLASLGDPHLADLHLVPPRVLLGQKGAHICMDPWDFCELML